MFRFTNREKKIRVAALSHFLGRLHSYLNPLVPRINAHPSFLVTSWKLDSTRKDCYLAQYHCTLSIKTTTLRRITSASLCYAQNPIFQVSIKPRNMSFSAGFCCEFDALHLPRSGESPYKNWGSILSNDPLLSLQMSLKTLAFTSLVIQRTWNLLYRWQLNEQTQ